MSKRDTQFKRLLRLKEVAEFLGASVKTVQRHIASGELAAIRIGSVVRVLPDDLSRFIFERRKA